MADLADLIGALRAILIADANIAAMTQGRVFGGELARGEAAAMPRHAIVLKESGGVSIASGTYLNHDTQRIDAHYYGPTRFEAKELAKLGYMVFRRQRRAVVDGVLIHWINSAGGASDGQDADGKWPMSFRSYQAFFALEEVEPNS